MKKKILKGFMLILALTVVLSSTVFAQVIPTPAPTVETGDTEPDTGIKGIDVGLVTDVGKASQDFIEDIIQKINISTEKFGEKEAIDDLIILMEITLEFTSEVINIIVDRETKNGLKTNLTVNETNLIEDERMGEAFQYLRYLQSEDPVREAINKMEENRTINVEKHI